MSVYSVVKVLLRNVDLDKFPRTVNGVVGVGDIVKYRRVSILGNLADFCQIRTRFQNCGAFCWKRSVERVP